MKKVRALWYIRLCIKDLDTRRKYQLIEWYTAQWNPLNCSLCRIMPSFTIYKKFVDLSEVYPEDETLENVIPRARLAKFLAQGYSTSILYCSKNRNWHFIVKIYREVTVKYLRFWRNCRSILSYVLKIFVHYMGTDNCMMMTYHVYRPNLAQQSGCLEAGINCSDIWSLGSKVLIDAEDPIVIPIYTFAWPEPFPLGEPNYVRDWYNIAKYNKLNCE